MSDSIDKKGLLGWFASNHVAANLLMLFIVVSGLLSLFSITMEVFPDLSIDMITVTVPYLGASPEDVENGVIQRVEEAIGGVDGIKKMTSYCGEGVGTVLVEVDEYADTKEVLDDIKAEVDRIITFPEETEEPEITELTTRNKVISIMVSGNASEKTLKTIADQMRDDLTAMDNISLVSVAGIRPYEISIEVSEETLRRYGLTFDRVAQVVNQSSLDIPAGSVKTTGGEILVRTKGQRYYGPQFENIVVLTRPDGTVVRLGDIATVKDDFEDIDLYTIFDGQKAAYIKVYRIGDQDVISITDTIKKYIEEKQKVLPQGIKLNLWEDQSEILKDRMNLLLKNARYGLILVFICLALFLDLKLAFWTTMGIPISFLGAFWLMPAFDITINMLSLFSLIVCLGIVVDDAIVVGENIFTYRQQGMDPTEAAIKGVKEMAVPVILAVLTTIFAFVPLAFTKGVWGKILVALPIIISSVLFISLIEALLILPAHLSSKIKIKSNIITKSIDNLRIWISGKLEFFIQNIFTNWVEAVVKFRYITLSAALAILLFTFGLIKGGYIGFSFFDPVEADNMVAWLKMPLGTPVEKTTQITQQIYDAAEQIRSEYDKKYPSDKSIVKHIAITIGAHPATGNQGPMSIEAGAEGASHLAEVNVEFLGGEERPEGLSIKELMNQWRDIVGEIPGATSLKFISEIASLGEPINVELSHAKFDTLLTISEELKNILAEYSGTTDITDSFEEGKPELKLNIKDTGRVLGLTLGDLARQVRQGFYGEQAQRIQRGRDDIRVMVRYPKDQRKSIADIENMRIRLPDGTEIPFKAVAEVQYGRGYALIRRVDKRRIIAVTADVTNTELTEEINKDLIKNVLPELQQKYPGLTYTFGGERKERNESLGSLLVNFPIALLAIYALLAVQFKSYVQPIIVMSAIPFGIVGATLGHLALGFNLSFLSMFGLVALAGVVVNDSLILIDLINREREQGIAGHQLIRDCATRRFRPIMLTTLTTFLGLTPIMLEKSLQAQFLIPMAISLAFGVLFATMITLLLVPSLYMIIEDIKQFFTKKTNQLNAY
ncbi:MAG: efflux RND transporter permease subunit [Sedimentisphaerales bacterium]|nr:efflux RND transporter permease subunit [Sedimentisphaerales bacterium]